MWRGMCASLGAQPDCTCAHRAGQPIYLQTRAGPKGRVTQGRPAGRQRLIQCPHFAYPTTTAPEVASWHPHGHWRLLQPVARAPAVPKMLPGPRQPEGCHWGCCNLCASCRLSPPSPPRNQLHLVQRTATPPTRQGRPGNAFHRGRRRHDGTVKGMKVTDKKFCSTPPSMPFEAERGFVVLFLSNKSFSW